MQEHSKIEIMSNISIRIWIAQIAEDCLNMQAASYLVINKCCKCFYKFIISKVNLLSKVEETLTIMTHIDTGT